MGAVWRYPIGGRQIEFWVAEAATAVRLQQLWQTVFQPAVNEPASPAPDVVVRFRFPHSATLPCPAVAVPLRQAANLQIWRTADGFYLACGEARLALTPALGVAVGALPPAFWERPLNQQREFFTFALFFLVRPRGLYALHANALRYREQDVLLAGPSGSGKTTLTLSLLLAGWQGLGDDALLLEEGPDGVIVHGLRRGVSCTDATLALFPHLTLPPDAPVLDRQKRLLPLTTTSGRQPVSRPQALFLPTIVAQPQSWVQPLSAGDALFALLKLTVGLLLDETLAPSHLQTLSRLVAQTRAYRLWLGQDGLTEPAAVVRLVEHYVETCA